MLLIVLHIQTVAHARLMQIVDGVEQPINVLRRKMQVHVLRTSILETLAALHALIRKTALNVAVKRDVLGTLVPQHVSQPVAPKQER